MIDTVAKAIMKWCVPFNDWDAITESQREQFRGAARAAIDAVPGWEGIEVRESYGEFIKGKREQRVMVPLDQIASGLGGHNFRQVEDGKVSHWQNVIPEIKDGYAIFTLTDDNLVTPTDG